MASYTFNGFARRSAKHSKLHLFKLSVGLVTLSLLLIFYGQYLIHTRCDSVECKGAVDTSSSSAAAKNAGDLTAAAIPAAVTATKMLSTGAKSDVPIEDDITSRRQQPWENTGENSDATNKKSDDYSGGGDTGFAVFDPPLEKPAKELIAWIEKMSNSADASAVVADPSPVAPGAKEFLFPCARDEYIISDSLKSSNDEGENIDGVGSVEFVEESLCRSLNVRKASGTFKDGKLNGEGVIVYLDGSFMKASFKEGVLHGLVRKYRCQFGLCDFFESQAWSDPKYLWEISWYRNGYRVGVAWEFKIGGGAVVGHVDSNGDLSGPDIVFIYPDNGTVLVGRFNKGVLVSAQESRLAGLEMEGEIAIPLTLLPKGPVYTYEQSNKTHMGSLHLRDPLEEQYLSVRASTVDGAGRGIFLKKDVTAGTVVGYYNGVRMSDVESKIRRADRKSPYRLDNDWATRKQVLNIPEGFRELKQYNATLGHLINHSKSANAWYAPVEHPRFGKIRSVVTMTDLKAGDELFCDYGFIDQYVQGEKMFKTIMDVGQVLSNKDAGEFNKDMKYTVKYLRNKADQFQPYYQMFKSVYNMIKA